METAEDPMIEDSNNITLYYEKLKNHFYDGLTEEVLQENFGLEPKKEDFVDEDLEEFFGEQPDPKLFQEQEQIGLSSGEIEENRLKKNLRPLSPVRKSQVKEIELPSLPSFDSVDYRTLLHQEIGESVEMFRMRERIANYLYKAEFPRGSTFVSMDTQTILLLSRMFANRFWFDMKYSKEQEDLLNSIIKHIPELNV